VSAGDKQALLDSIVRASSALIHGVLITHLSRPSEFDDAAQVISGAQLDTHYVPGEHDMLDPEVTLYRDRHGRGTKGAGWYSFDASGRPKSDPLPTHKPSIGSLKSRPWLALPRRSDRIP